VESAASAAPIIPISRGRPSARQLTERLERQRAVNAILRDELTALRSEREDAAVEIEALARRMTFAVQAGRDDVALHVLGRLDALGAALRRRGDGAA
jgi:hypothetical protein